MLRQLLTMQRLLLQSRMRLTQPGFTARSSWGEAPPATHMRALYTQQQPARYMAAASSSGGEGVAAAAAGSDPVAPATSTTTSTDGPSYHDWRMAWRDFLQYIHAEGHYSADPGVPEDALDSNAGAAWVGHAQAAPCLQQCNA